MNNNLTIHNNISTCCDWEFISHTHINTKQTNAYNNECIPAQFGYIGFAIGNILYAVYIDRDVIKGFYIR